MRIWYGILLVSLLISCKTKKSTINSQSNLLENTTHLQDQSLAPFYHGVASGDPYKNSIVLWTRVTPKTKMEAIEVSWEISEDKNFENLVNKGQFTTYPSRDYTVKIVAAQLSPNTKYYYRFSALDSHSITGTTQTLPADDEPIKLAVVSCSNIEFGYFNAYAAIANEDVNAVLHLGDYIYEYGPDYYGDKTFHRKNIPAHEIISLQDYRDRYSQYIRS